ncbi:MAG TPA: polymorphic toxin type 28 domain-containing protein [Acidimicrobiales bacterium]
MVVTRGDGPTAEEGARQLASATAEFEAALEERSPGSAGAPETGAGAVIVEAVAAAGRAGRAEVTAAARAALADLHAGDAQLGALLAKGGGAAVDGVTAADRQAASAVTTSVAETKGRIAGDRRDHGSRIGTWSAQAISTADRVVGEQAGKAQAAGGEQARQARAAGREAEQREAAVVRTAAAQAKSEPAAAAGGPDAPAPAKAAQGPGARARAAEAATALRGGGSKVAAAVAGEAKPLTSALSRTATDAEAAVGQVAAGATREADQGGAGARGRIAAAARTTTTALRTRAGEARGAGAAAAARLVAAMAGAVRRTLGASVDEEQAAAARFGRLRAAPGAAGRIAQTVGRQIEDSHAGTANDLRQGGKEAAAQLQDYGSASTADLGAAGAEVETAMASGAAQSATAVRGVAAPAGQAFGTVVAKATASGDEAVARTGQNLAGVVGQAETGLGRVTSDVRTGLGDHEAHVSNRAQTLLSRTTPSAGPSVQLNIPPHPHPVKDWFGDQMSDLKGMLTDPGFWVGAAVTIVGGLALALVMPEVIAAGIALVIGGLIGGAISALWENRGSVLKGALIGGLIGLVFFAGGLILAEFGLAGLALLGAVMALGALIGIVVNIATGHRPDKGLLANLLLAGVFHKFSQWLQARRGRGQGQPEPDEPTGKQDEPTGKEDEPAKAPRDEDEPDPPKRRKTPVLQAARQAVVERASVLADHVRRLRQRLGNTAGFRNPALAQKLEREARAARDIMQEAENATTDAEVNQLNRRVDALQEQVDGSEVGVLRDEAGEVIDAVERRVAALRDRIPAENKPKPPDPGQPAPTSPDRSNPAALRKGVDEAANTARDLRSRHRQSARETLRTSADMLEALKKEGGKLLVKLNELEVANESFLFPATLESEGVSKATAAAVRTIDALERKSLGDRHRSPKDDRHFSAARLEAAGVPVKGKGKAAGDVPFNHVQEIQVDRNGVFSAREAIVAELEHPPRDLTPYGQRQLRQQLEKAHTIIREVDQFLDEIGWPADRPFKWVKDGREWVPAADVKAMQDRVSGQLTTLREGLEGRATRNTIRDIRITNPSVATALESRRFALHQEMTRQQAALRAAQTEPQVNAVQQAVERLQRLWSDLQQDIHLGTVPR